MRSTFHWLKSFAFLLPLSAVSWILEKHLPQFYWIELAKLQSILELYHYVITLVIDLIPKSKNFVSTCLNIGTRNVFYFYFLRRRKYNIGVLILRIFKVFHQNKLLVFHIIRWFLSVENSNIEQWWNWKEVRWQSDIAEMVIIKGLLLTVGNSG